MIINHDNCHKFLVLCGPYESLKPVQELYCLLLLMPPYHAQQSTLSVISPLAFLCLQPSSSQDLTARTWWSLDNTKCQIMQSPCRPHSPLMYVQMAPYVPSPLSPYVLLQCLLLCVEPQSIVYVHYIVGLCILTLLIHFTN